MALKLYAAAVCRRRALSAVLMSTVLMCGAVAQAQQSPALPAGLGASAQNALQSAPPALPPGLTPNGTAAPAASGMHAAGAVPPPASGIPFSLTGFWEMRAGARVRDDRHEKSTPLGELRAQIEAEKQWRGLVLNCTADAVYDTVEARNRIRLDRGEGWIDLRQASVAFTPAAFIDVKAGRQIMTWGTGDFVFINDLFPKDWKSFFIGRDVEYLKAPSDAVRVALYGAMANVDIYYVPYFNQDRFIDGRRLSFWNSAAGRRTGKDSIVRPRRRRQWFRDHEMGLRIFRNIRGYETALYWYDGFWKSPAGVDSVSGKAVFPELTVFGGSLRGRVLHGIGNAEWGYYLSKDDRSGDDPFVRNSELRILLGYEEEVTRDFTVGLQYYLERMLHYGAYRNSLARADNARDRHRHVVTLRLTRLLMDQNLTLSLFVYFSPTDSDSYVRPLISYKFSDRLTVEGGANVFYGRHDHTFFAQFENNTNFYCAVRRYFSRATRP